MDSDVMDDLEFTETLCFGRNAERAIAPYRGHVIFLETRFPSWGNFLGRTAVESKIGSVSVPPDNWRMKIAAEFGGTWEHGYYAGEGFGWPVFDEDDLCERARKCIDAWIEKGRKRDE